MCNKIKVNSFFILFFLALTMLFGSFAFAVDQRDSISSNINTDGADLTQYARLNEDGSVDDSYFEVVDEITDRADLADGNSVYRIYQEPRLIYTDIEGKKRLREPGWNLFHETIESRIEGDKRNDGYKYIVPFSNEQKIIVTPGNIENIESKENIVPQAGTLWQFDKDFQTISTYKDIYPNMDVRFRDIGEWRRREIIIKQKPGGIKDGDELIFWENFTIPDRATVLVGPKEYRSEIVTSEPIIIKLSSGDLFGISGAITFDSKYIDSTYQDMSNTALKHIVRLDQENKILSIGIIMKSEYFDESVKTYPVIIDPSYIVCQSGTACMTDLYLRGLADAPDSTNDYLRSGYEVSTGSPAVCAPAGKVIRITALKFLLDSSGIPSGSNISSAKIKLKYYKPTGCANTTNITLMKPKIINTPWSAGSVKYNDIRGNLTSGGTTSNVGPNACTNNLCFWDLNVSTVQGWFNNTITNNGFVIEPEENWSSGTTAPASWTSKNIVYMFYSSRYSGGTYKPYLEIIADKPDLTDNNSDHTPKTIELGQSVNITFNIKNTSATAVGQTSVLKYYINPAGNCSSRTTYISSFTVPTMSGNGTYSKTVSYTPTSQGSFCFQFDIDANDNVAESNENNNGFYITNTLTVNPVAKPDLKANSYSLNKYTAAPGETINSTLKVGNGGTVSSGSTQVYYYLNKDSCSVSSGYLGSTSLSSVSSGGEVTVSYSPTIPSGATANSNYYLGYYIDKNNPGDIAESNEINNSGCFDPITISGKAELEVSGFTIADTSQKYSGLNQTLSVYGRVRNTGSVSTNNVTYSLTLKDINNGTTYSLGSLSPSTLNLGVGYDQYITLSGIIPSGMQYSGNYQVEVFLDSNTVVLENDEGNNKKLTSNSVNIQQYYYGSGGGNIDTDNDGLSNIEEAQPGTNVTTPNTNPTDDSQEQNHGNDNDEGIGDPVNARTGSFELTQTDFSLPGRGEEIDFVRVYNSKVEESGRFGNGWNFSYNQYYYKNPNTNKAVVYKSGSRASFFDTNDNGVTFIPQPGENNKLYWQNNSLVLEKNNGTKYYYSNQLTENLGLLESIVDTNGNTTKLNYTTVRDVKLLSNVTDSSGRNIIFSYGNSTSDQWDKVQSISYNTQSGQIVFSYSYDAQLNLTQVSKANTHNGVTDYQVDQFSPNQQKLIEKYTDPRGTILYNTYDNDGRVTSQYEYNPNIDSIGTQRKIYEFNYLGEDPAVPNDAYCTVVKSFSKIVEYTSQKICFNQQNLKVYDSGKDGNELFIVRNQDGMVQNVKDKLNRITKYEYDNQRRKIKEILPDTEEWHTETSFSYGPFNRIIAKTTKVWSVGSDYNSPEQDAETTIYTIDSTNGNILSIKDPMQYTESYSYDQYGNVLSYTDKNNNVITRQYSTDGNYLIKEEKEVTLANSVKQIITKEYGYDEYGNCNYYKTPEGAEYRYYFDNQNNLLKEVNPNLDYKTYVYDLEGHKTDMYDELNFHTQYIYDKDIGASLLEEKKYNLDGSKIIKTSQIYDNLGRISSNFDANGNETKTVYDEEGRVFKKIDSNKTVQYSYYEDGNVFQEIMYASGSTSANWMEKTEYVYDSRNNNIEIRKYLDNYDNYIFTKNYYDGFNRLIKKQDANGNKINNFYDLNDRLIMVVDVMGNTTTYHYDGVGNKIGEKNALCYKHKDYCNSAGYSEFYQYDEANRIKKETNVLGKQTVYFYNKNGQVVKIIDRQDADGTNNNHVKQFEYDALGRKTLEKDAYNSTISFTYDKVGNLKTKTDQMGRTYNYVYDDFGRLVQENDPSQYTTFFAYDNNGNKTSITYPDGKTTTYVYNAQNLLTQIKDALNNNRKFTYDAIGNKLSETDKNGHITTLNYDKINRLIKEVNSQDTITTYTYNNSGNRLSENVAGKVTSFSFDKLGRVLSITKPDNKIESYEYDSLGHLEGKTDSEGNRTDFWIAKGGNTVGKWIYDGKTSTLSGVVSYNYDNWNNLTWLEIGSSDGDILQMSTYAYDNENRLLAEKKSFADLSGKTFNINRTYYLDGKIKEITDVTGMVITYEYDSRGLLHNVKKGEEIFAEYLYNAMNRPNTLTYANGVVNNYTYDDLQRVTDIEIKSGTSTLFKQEYTYDGESNRTKLVEDDNNTVNYSYDSLGQLTNVDYSNITGANDINFTYDKWGNRTKLITSLATTNYTYANDSNKLISFTQNNRLTTNLAYDNNGSLSTESVERLNKPLRTTNYIWDKENRLKTINYNYDQSNSFLPTLKNNSMQFEYDDYGNRIKKTVNNKSSYYINDGLRVLNELDSVGMATKSIIYGIGEIAEIGQNGKINFIHQDVLDSTVLITNQTGEEVAKYNYDVFGSTTGYSGTEEVNYLFTNQEFDSESELYYYNARYYNPKLGRFISKDPVLGKDGDILSKNGYIYVKNNPLKYTDPSGYIEEEKQKEKFEIWVKHPFDVNVDRPVWESDFGHAMIGISNVFYGYGPVKDSGHPLIGMKGQIFKNPGLEYNPTNPNYKDYMLEYYNLMDNGAIFTVYEIGLSDEERGKIFDHLEYWDKHVNEMPGYNAITNNCVDYLIDIMDEFTNLSIDPFGFNSPTNLSEKLFKQYKSGYLNGVIKNMYGGFEIDKQFHKVDVSNLSNHNKVMSELESQRDRAYGYVNAPILSPIINQQDYLIKT